MKKRRLQPWVREARLLAASVEEMDPADSLCGGEDVACGWPAPPSLANHSSGSGFGGGFEAAFVARNPLFAPQPGRVGEDPAPFLDASCCCLAEDASQPFFPVAAPRVVVVSKCEEPLSLTSPLGTRELAPEFVTLAGGNVDAAWRVSELADALCTALARMVRTGRGAGRQLGADDVFQIAARLPAEAVPPSAVSDARVQTAALLADLGARKARSAEFALRALRAAGNRRGSVLLRQMLFARLHRAWHAKSRKPKAPAWAALRRVVRRARRRIRTAETRTFKIEPNKNAKR